MNYFLKDIVKPVKKTLSLKHVNQTSYIKSIINEAYGISGDQGMTDWSLFYDITTLFHRIDIEFQMRTQSAVLIIDGAKEARFPVIQGVVYFKPPVYTGWHLKLIKLEEEE